jgi:hypothetical protein
MTSHADADAREASAASRVAIGEEEHMTDVQVTRINRQPGSRAHEGITHLAGDSWRWTSRQVADSIEAGTNTFFVLENGHRADVSITTGSSGACLRTRVDGHWTDGLLALPECRLHEGSD